ncbi:MAG: AAA family ATPase, partial [Planctomycetes bacterium]|nr:AAA family ATPase [Planctomycetota bacterium]
MIQTFVSYVQKKNGQPPKVANATPEPDTTPMPEPGGWGLTREPFTLCADPEMLYLGAGHRDALARLLYAVRTHKGGALLVSEDAGDGKTSLLRRLLLDLAVPGAPPVLSAFIEYPTLTPTQMLRAIATGLGAPKALRDKATAVASLREHLLAHRATGGVAVVVVDEGQLLADRTAVLQELRILLNLSTPEGFLLTFLLSGQKPLMAAVKAIPELWQRLPVRIFLD